MGSFAKVRTGKQIVESVETGDARTVAACTIIAPQLGQGLVAHFHRPGNMGSVVPCSAPKCAQQGSVAEGRLGHAGIQVADGMARVARLKAIPMSA